MGIQEQCGQDAQGRQVAGCREMWSIVTEGTQGESGVDGHAHIKNTSRIAFFHLRNIDQN